MKKDDAKGSQPLRFKALIQSSGKTAAGMQIPPEVVEALGAGKRPPVRVTINGFTYRSSIAVMNGVYMLGVSNEVREKAGVSAGEKVDVELELDTQPREISLPHDFAAALSRDAKARQFFEGLSYSNKRRIVEPIGAAKAPETRQRRIEKAINSLREGRL
ncbi:MAG TPA: YdeI/OmpD-associated family protein [Anaerolineales bacterium]